MSFLPKQCGDYLREKKIQFEECEDQGEKAIILKDFALPQGQFDALSADILILLPSGYPDTSPDMFYTIPWLKLTASSGYPNAANQSFHFKNRDWQRWSRHTDEWRPGFDGIWNVIKRIERALETA